MLYDYTSIKYKNGSRINRCFIAMYYNGQGRQERGAKGAISSGPP